MATPQMQLLYVILSFSLLEVLPQAPKVVQLLMLFGLSYTGYIWSCEYLHDMTIYMGAAWNARHLHQLSETCRDLIDSATTAPHHPWYEQYLHCTGELRGIETWRTYHQCTSPHYLLFYIMAILFIYLIVIKRGTQLLNNVFNNQPPIGDDAVAPMDILALPGSYHNYSSLAHVAKINRALEKAVEDARDARNSAAVFNEAREKEFEDELRKASEHGADIDFLRKEKDFLKYDLKTALGSEKHHMHELHKFQLAIAKERLHHRKELAAVTAELVAVKNHASSCKRARRPSRRSTRPSGSATEKDTKQILLREQRRIAEKDIRRLTYRTPPAAVSVQSAPRNRQLMTDNARLTMDLTSTKEKLESVQNALDSSTPELRRANEDLMSSRTMAKDTESKLEKARCELEKFEVDLQSKTAELREAQGRVASSQTALLQNKELLVLRDIELRSVQDVLASTNAKVDLGYKDVERLQNELESTKSDLRDTVRRLHNAMQELEASLVTNQQLTQDVCDANTRIQKCRLAQENGFTAQREALADMQQDRNNWRSESHRQGLEIVNVLKPTVFGLEQEVYLLNKQVADSRDAQQAYIRKKIIRIGELEEEARTLRLLQNNEGSQTEIARLQKLLAVEQPIRRDAQHKVYELQKLVDRFDEERAFYQQQQDTDHYKEVESLKQKLAESAHRQIKINNYDDVKHLKAEIDQLHTAANRQRAALEKEKRLATAKASATEQILKLRKEAKEKGVQLMKALDAAHGAEKALQEAKQLRGELAEKDKQLRLEKTRAEAAEIAPTYVMSQGLAKTQEYQTYKEAHAQQARTGFSAREDDHNREA